MSDVHGRRRPESDRDHLARSRRVWDRWADHYAYHESDFGPLLDEAVERLELDPGDTVLEVGCGPGVNLERLRNLVGPSGRVVAVDYSPKMVERARAVVTEHGWTNVEVVRADATRLELAPETIDGAFASLSTSVMPDATAACRRVHEALVPGGRFVVFDLRRFQRGLLRALNPLLVLFYRWFANWNTDEDVLASLRTTFETVAVEETYAAGAAYRAVARKAAEATTRKNAT